MRDCFDVIIIGAGLAGCALAYYLSRQKLDVLVLEVNSIAGGTTAACAGRAQIIESESEEYLALVVRGFNKLSSLGDELDVDLQWRLPGHLTLLTSEEQWSKFDFLTQRLRTFGLAAEMLPPDQLVKIEPALSSFRGLGAAYSQEGHLNPLRLCHGYAQAARRSGAEIIINCGVTGFEFQRGEIQSVITHQTHYHANRFILATGAWSNNLMAKLGCPFPLQFTCAQALVTESMPPFIHHHIGFSGFYQTVHGQQRSVTLGLGQHPAGNLFVSNAIQPADIPECSPSVWGLTALCQNLSRQFPVLSNIRVLRSWAAASPFLPDYLPAIGNVPQFKNLTLATGFHLAIPTIPLICEEFAHAFQDSELTIFPDFLQAFSPERFLHTTM